jgi:hypothetical protein
VARRADRLECGPDIEGDVGHHRSLDALPMKARQDRRGVRVWRP